MVAGSDSYNSPATRDAEIKRLAARGGRVERFEDGSAIVTLKGQTYKFLGDDSFHRPAGTNAPGIQTAKAGSGSKSPAAMPTVSPTSASPAPTSASGSEFDIASGLDEGDTLLSRLNFIVGFIGGNPVEFTDDELAEFDTEAHTEDDGHDHGGERQNAPGGLGAIEGWTGGTMTEASRDSKGPTPGASALMGVLTDKFGGTSGGIYNYRNIRGGDSLSVHAEGRAGDLMVPVGAPLGDNVSSWLEANADRLGIQRIIWKGRSWDRKRRVWRDYNGVNPHNDHVHWELTPEAAARPDLYNGLGGKDAKGGSPVAKEKFGDLGSRLDAVRDVLGGRKRAADVDGERADKYGDPVGSMAATFAKARQRQPTAGKAASRVALASGEPGDLQRHALSRFAEFGWSNSEAAALIELWQRESGWNPAAQNPTSTAFGIAQFLDSTWAGVGAKKSSDPSAQIDAGLRYIKQRYGSPTAAMAFWRRNHWY
jgi:hypothetical protein